MALYFIKSFLWRSFAHSETSATTFYFTFTVTIAFFISGCKNCCLACDSEQLFGYLLKGIKGEPINMILSMSKL
jgi:hypothetical protein